MTTCNGRMHAKESRGGGKKGKKRASSSEKVNGGAEVRAEEKARAGERRLISRVCDIEFYFAPLTT